ncbi:MAG: hypothetical protein ABI341_04740 [Nitrososphaera sp.]
MNAGCCWEEQVLAELRQAGAPETLPEPVREHLAGCQDCASLAAAVFALRQERELLAGFAPVPDAGAVWRRMQCKAWREAATAAGRPITAVQVLAFAGAAGVAGACYGATSQWFQGLLGRSAAWLWAGLRTAPAGAEALSWPWLALAAAALGAFLLAPIVLYFVLSAEKS